jgi:hypothetical protein
MDGLQGNVFIYFFNISSFRDSEVVSLSSKIMMDFWRSMKLKYICFKFVRLAKMESKMSRN